MALQSSFRDGDSPTAAGARAAAGARDAAGARTGDHHERALWTFLTNHAHVLFCIAQDPTVRLRDVAVRVGITERAAQSIVADLVAAGYLTRERVGRRNRYQVLDHQPLRHPMERHRSVAELIKLVLADDADATVGAATRKR